MWKYVFLFGVRQIEKLHAEQKFEKFERINK